MYLDSADVEELHRQYHLLPKNHCLYETDFHTHTVTWQTYGYIDQHNDHLYCPYTHVGSAYY